MSNWLVHLVRLAKVGNHPNADSLDITSVYGQSVICKRGLFKEGDLAVYVPPDSVLPEDPNSPVLKDSGMLPGQRVEAKKLRGIFSNGFLIPALEVFSLAELDQIDVGSHVAERLGITKFKDEGDLIAIGSENETDPGYMPKYTDIDGWPKYRNQGIIQEGDEVVLTEKIHGANARFCYHENRLWVGSRDQIKASYCPPSDGIEKNMWWKVAKNLDLENKFKKLEDDGVVLYGEIYGKVQHLRYGLETDYAFRLFDTWSRSKGHYNDWRTTQAIARTMELETVPELYTGPWKPELEELRNGPSILYPGHTREGFVIKPLVERFHISETRKGFSGRVIFKFVGEDYELSKNKKK